MVSWLRSFELNWKHLESLFDPSDAVDLQLAFQGIPKAPDPSGAFKAWVKKSKGMPGAILFPGGGPKRGGGGSTPGGRVVPNFKVGTLHHLKPAEEGDEGDTFICLKSLKGFATTVTVPIEELLSGLVSETKASTKSVRERNIPPEEEFLELKTEDVKANYKAKAGEICIKAELTERLIC